MTDTIKCTFDLVENVLCTIDKAPGIPEWGLILIGAAAGALLAAIKDIVTYFQSTKKKARYLAIRVVCVLDQFIDDCVNALVPEPEDAGGQVYYSYGPIPDVSEYPDDLDWKSIDGHLSYKILNLPSRIEFARQRIRSVSEFDGPPYDDTNEKLQYEIATLGVFACELASELRKKYSIPYRGNSPWSHDFEPCLHLNETKETLENSLKKRGELPPEWNG